MGGQKCLHRPNLLWREGGTDDDFLDAAVVGMRGRTEYIPGNWVVYLLLARPGMIWNVGYAVSISYK